MTKVTELRTKEPAHRALVIQAIAEADREWDCDRDMYEWAETLYNLAYKAGEKAMQERAAKVCDGASFYEDDPQGYAHQCSIAIRALELTGENNE